MHSFLPEEEKAILLKQLREAYGLASDTVGQNEMPYIPARAWGDGKY